MTENPERVSNALNAEDYSSLAKLLRITAWVKRFINNSREKMT